MRFDDPDVLSLSEAAKVLPGKISTSTIWRWATTGQRGVRLDSLRIGGRIYTSRRALQSFCEAVSDRAVVEKPHFRDANAEAELAELRRLGFRV